MCLFLHLTGFCSFTMTPLIISRSGTQAWQSLWPYPAVRQLLLPSDTETAHSNPHVNVGKHPGMLPQTYSQSQMHLPVLATEGWVVTTYLCGWQRRLPAASLLTRQPDVPAVGSGAAAAVGRGYLQPSAARLAGHDG